MEALELWTAEDDDTGLIAIVFVMPKGQKHHFSMNREFTLELIKDLEGRVKFDA